MMAGPRVCGTKAVFHFVMLRAEKGEILHCLQELHFSRRRVP